MAVPQRDAPGIWLAGATDHADFRTSLAMLRTMARVDTGLPELIVLAQDHPGRFRQREIERLRRSAPLAGIVALLGSWCEGESRTGRPLTGVRRLYWYEFPAWWQSQCARWHAGMRPEWTTDVEEGSAVVVDLPLRVAVDSLDYETGATLADVVGAAGGTATWQRRSAYGAAAEAEAGIWVGSQFDDDEAVRLTDFCARLGKQNAPVVALLDFPRRDRCAAAIECGAAVVLGKPCANRTLLATLRRLALGNCGQARAA